jgi:hypothetical protein
MVIYFMVICFLTYMVYAFLIKLNYYKKIHNLTFYAIAYIVLLVRMTELVYVMIY